MGRYVPSHVLLCTSLPPPPQLCCPQHHHPYQSCAALTTTTTTPTTVVLPLLPPHRNAVRPGVSPLSLLFALLTHPATRYPFITFLLSPLLHPSFPTPGVAPSLQHTHPVGHYHSSHSSNTIKPFLCSPHHLPLPGRSSTLTVWISHFHQCSARCHPLSSTKS